MINEIPNSVASPHGVATHFALDEFKNTILKYRPTHDLSIDQSPDNSVNHRLCREDFPELIYGFCLPRMLHYVHDLRLANPEDVILVSKIDIKLAHRRCIMRGDMAKMGITMMDDRAMLNLRKTFGGTFGPYFFTDIVSESATNLGNDLLSCPNWNGEELKSPHVDDFDPPLLL